MGREVRRVPADWDHPTKMTNGHVHYQPKHFQSCKDALEQWLTDLDRIRAGDLDDIERECYPNGLVDWLQDYRAPDPEYHMPDWDDDQRTHFQMYEDTSEGTPISPVMETPEVLAKWLAETGASAFADRTATYEQWLPICRGEFAPSAVITGNVIVSGVEAISENTE